MPDKLCLITCEMSPSIITMLEDIGYSVDYKPSILQNELEHEIKTCSGIIVKSNLYIDDKIIENGEHLKFIARAGAGLDNIDIQYAKQKKIMVINAPESNMDALAEHAMGMLLSMLNHIHIANEEVKNGIWNRSKNRGTELMNKTIGIIGYGNMGSAFAKRIAGFSCNVIAYDKYKTAFEDLYAKEVSLEDIFEYSDIISLHVPLTDDTLHMVNDSFLSQFKKPIYIINTSRGKVVKTADLIPHLKNKKILGVALDVLENEKINSLNTEEKLTFQTLAQLENVILTPHVAGWTYESLEKINLILAKKIRAGNF